MISILSKKILIFLIIIVVLGSLAIWFVYKYKQAEDQAEISTRQDQELNQQLENVPGNGQNLTTTTAVSTSSLKTYRNTEWGFEFRDIQ